MHCRSLSFSVPLLHFIFLFLFHSLYFSILSFSLFLSCLTSLLSQISIQPAVKFINVKRAFFRTYVISAAFFLCMFVRMYVIKAAKTTFVWKTREFNVDEIDTCSNSFKVSLFVTFSSTSFIHFHTHNQRIEATKLTWDEKVSISSTFSRIFFARNFGAKAKT